MLLTDHADGKPRCWWPGYDPLYVAYHDTDWGVPERDDRALFEKLILDGFQAGLSWITILRKREHFRKVFDGFRPDVVASYGPEKIEALMADPGIVRNRAKIEGTVKSAGIYCDMMARGEGFSDYLWSYVDGRPLQPDHLDRSRIPTETPVAQAISKDLKRRGFTFVGPTIVYAFMQAVGMTNDHVVGCFRHEEVKALG
ncbi:DNA-3-methyladenine glycosylase I [Phreatobacter oligotrophus]|uniref:DNA-3-methyladenine glycosylase I n=1 Tax=Phreatobacter oligotrophus TaxID=1122261 RepID=UPI002357CDB2|nr:DNA-3-methyladenine glycosylase I [Phreatobacter oligotrophus]MBX9989168.1 DNA-3-methyladenine glycosylase I [Phreatobacter oligotrophus]